MALTGSQLKKLLAARPKIIFNKPYTTAMIAKKIAEDLEMSPVQVKKVLEKLGKEFFEAVSEGAPFEFAGVGKFSPKINLKGEFSVGFRATKATLEKINEKNFFRGNIENKENIGK